MTGRTPKYKVSKNQNFKTPTGKGLQGFKEMSVNGYFYYKIRSHQTSKTLYES